MKLQALYFIEQIQRIKIHMKNNSTESSSTMKQRVATSEYILTSQLRDQKISLNLEIISKWGKTKNGQMTDSKTKNNNKYSGIFTFEQLHAQIKANFKELQNLIMYLNEVHNIQVNTETGRIDIVINADLPNGNKIKFGTSGFIQLHQHSEDDDIIENMENIVKICQSDKQLNQVHFKTLIKGLAKAITHIQISGTKKQEIQHAKLSNHSLASTMNDRLQSQLNNSIKSINDIKKDMGFLKQNQNQNNKKYAQFIQNCKKQLSEGIDKSKKQVKQEISYLIGGFKIQTNQQIRKLQKNLAYTNEQIKQISNRVQKIGELPQKATVDGKNGNYQLELFKKINVYMVQKIKQFQDIYDAKINQIHDYLSEVSKQTNAILQTLHHKNLSPNLQKTISTIETNYHFTQQLKKASGRFDDPNHSQQKLIKPQEKQTIFSNKFNIFGTNQNKLKSLKTTHSVYSASIPSQSWNLFSIPSSSQSHQIGYFNKQLKFYDKFVIQNNTIITYKGLDKKSTILLGKTPISQCNKFKIKLIKTSGRAIGLGIADANYKSQRQIRNLPNFIQYWAYDGSIWEGPSKQVKCEGGGIRQGETVTVKVGLKMGGIQWVVQDKVRASINTSKFLKTNVNWVPLIVMSNTEDCIEWIPIN